MRWTCALVVVATWCVAAAGASATVVKSGETWTQTRVEGDLQVQKGGRLQVTQGSPVAVTGTATFEEGSLLQLRVDHNVPEPILLLSALRVAGAMALNMSRGVSVCDPSEILVHVDGLLYGSTNVTALFHTSADCYPIAPGIVVAILIAAGFGITAFIVGCVVYRRKRREQMLRSPHTGPAAISSEDRGYNDL